jgi:hypothetical protein
MVPYFKKIFLFNCLYFVLLTKVFSQSYSEKIQAFTSQEGRLQNKQRIQNDIVWKTLQQYPENATDEARWESAFWGMEISLWRADSLRDRLKGLFKHRKKYSNSFQRSLWEALYTLYPKDFVAEAQHWINIEGNVRNFAMMAVYLAQADSLPQTQQRILKTMKHRFDNWNRNAILLSLNDFLNQKNEESPCFDELFAWQKTHQQRVIYSFQRPNRDYPGLAIVQDENGEFVKDTTGQLVAVEQLARSISNLPFFLTNGNSPQGLYSIQSEAPSENIYIGTSPTLVSYVPFEIAVDSFFHQVEQGNIWTLDRYWTMFPPEFKNTPSLTQAYWAGKAGRNEMILHGTTIDESYYQNQPYYPFTPSMGCITAKELWDKNGNLAQSEQQKLLQAFKKNTDAKGFLYVLNLSDKQEAVTLEEILEFVNKYETK